MAETSDYDPGSWRGHDFGAARKTYDAHRDRSYADATAKGIDASSLVATNLTTDSESPLVVLCDITGSMGAWPGVIFSKLPYLDIEGKTYLGPTMEISFGAIGDAPMGDTYPLQIRPFGTGTILADHLKAFVVEGKGGGDKCESYELAALYYARNVTMPKATKPILIFIGDEGLHERVEKAHAQANHINSPTHTDTTDIFKELLRKYAVALVRKSYSGYDAQIERQWAGLIGQENIYNLETPDRVVDVIFGILAKMTGQEVYFRGEIEGRQDAGQVDTVYKSLRMDPKGHLPVKGSKTRPGDGKSVMHLPGGKPTKGLLGK